MAAPITSTRSQAEHYRELALWTSDERTHRTLMDMARELEMDIPPSARIQPRNLPRSLS